VSNTYSVWECDGGNSYLLQEGEELPQHKTNPRRVLKFTTDTWDDACEEYEEFLEYLACRSPES